MWEFASPYSTKAGTDASCNLYFDKFVAFMRKLFRKWKALEATHSLTIVFFSRTIITNPVASEVEDYPKDVYGRPIEVCVILLAGVKAAVEHFLHGLFISTGFFYPYLLVCHCLRSRTVSIIRTTLQSLLRTSQLSIGMFSFER